MDYLDETTDRPRNRPAYLRALGNSELPGEVCISGNRFVLQTIFKHDSWAATALYANNNHKIVCKFNRQAPVLILPMRWVGRFLGTRETKFLKMLSGVPGIPRSYDNVEINGVRARYVSSHDFIPGKPLSISAELSPSFFSELQSLIHKIHDHRIAYVDLHKRENVIVGDDGHPYLIDFQISLYVPPIFGLGWFFRLFSESDLYHLEKHRRFLLYRNYDGMIRPWWIHLHRMIAVPLRTMRRRFLVFIAVRKGTGYAHSEAITEVGLRESQ